MPVDFEITEEQKMVLGTVEAIVKEFGPQRERIRKRLADENRFPQELWEAFARAGLLGSLLPERYGGSDMGLVTLAMAVERLAGGGLGNVLLILTSMDSLCILRNGSEQLKQRFLPGVAEGKLKFAFALTEPNAGSNTFRIETIARRRGNDYELTGEKVFITGADHADYMLLVARTVSRDDVVKQGLPKAFGLSVFMVDPRTPGITLSPIPTRGLEGMVQYSVHMETAQVPAANLVGTENEGAMALFNSLNPERILAAASCCGMTEFLLGKATGYARERRVFGNRPIGSHQAIQHPLAAIRIRQEAQRLVTYKAAWAFDGNRPPAEIGALANMAKYLGADLAIDAADRAIQTLGGYGFSEEYEIIHYWEAARLIRTAPISQEMILNFTAEHTLGLPRSY